MAEGNQEKTFTQEEVDNIVTERLAREKKKYSDYDVLQEKAAKFDEQQEKGKSEIQKLQESNQSLLDKMASMEKQERITTMRSTVSKNTGVPAELLTGEDEDTCKTQAEGILKFAKGKTYPGVKGGNNTSRESRIQRTTDEPTEDDFRALAQQIFGGNE